MTPLRTRKAALLFLPVILSVSGCVHATRALPDDPQQQEASGFVSFFKRVFGSTPKHADVVTVQAGDVALQDAATLRAQRSLERAAAPMPIEIMPSRPNYGIIREENLFSEDEAVAASRISEPAQYRMLYFPTEQGEDYLGEPHRELLPIRREQMRSTAFGVGDRNDGVALSSAPDVPRARDYVAPARSAAEAASRLQTPRADLRNTAVTEGLYTVSEYRRAKVRTKQGEALGRVRPLGVVGADPQSQAAALQALNRAAGEYLVYFPHDFGWGGFIPDSPEPYTR